MTLYTPHSIFHLARLLYVTPETFGPYYVLILSYYLAIYVQGLRETTTNLSYDSPFPHRNKTGSPRTKRVLPSRLYRSDLPF